MLETDRADALTLQSGPLGVEIALRPFTFTVRRNGRSLLRAGGAWVVDGQVRDQFLQFTEGVLAMEDRAAVQRALSATVSGAPAGGG